MKNKVFLPMIEQMCMILLFAVIASLCLQGFSIAKNISAEHRRQDRAAEISQNVVEMIKSSSKDLSYAAAELDGEMRDGILTIYFDKDWSAVRSHDSAEYILTAELTESGIELLNKAVIQVHCAEDVIYSLTAGWQKEAAE